MTQPSPSSGLPITAVRALPAQTNHFLERRCVMGHQRIGNLENSSVADGGYRMLASYTYRAAACSVEESEREVMRDAQSWW
ncbi:hypothetical protein E2C01_050404 [Portunus trituberculatus]|uniref:Uncharacterized protein n=1 Tax=Portunus trituberculatus TaxID=210409 RepID=A0A5B7GGE5_PORTR|nr:hypothetical protein [Portunus trituberculatus]